MFRTSALGSAHVLRTNLNFSGVGTMGTGEVHCTPQVQDLYPMCPQVKDAAYVKILSKRLLTTRLAMVRTNLYHPPTYENVPMRLLNINGKTVRPVGSSLAPRALGSATAAGDPVASVSPVDPTTSAAACRLPLPRDPCDSPAVDAPWRTG